MSPASPSFAGRTASSSSSDAFKPAYSALTPLGNVRGKGLQRPKLLSKLGRSCNSCGSGTSMSGQRAPTTSWAEAFQRMLEVAVSRGANGVVAVAPETDLSGLEGRALVVASGTAVLDSCTRSALNGAGMMEGWTCTVEGETTVYYSLGVVTGLTVRSRNAVAQPGEEARRQASLRMVTAALARGANGLLAVRYEQNEISDGVTEVIAYGTAVTSDDGGDFCSARSTTASSSASVMPLSMITTSSVFPSIQEQFSLGVVQGISVCMSSLPYALGGGVKGLVGGEIKNWTEMCSDSRENAFNVMVEEACRRGAKGIVAMRYNCKQVGSGIVEVIVCGTAVSNEPLAEKLPDLAKGAVADLPPSVIRSVQSVKCTL